MNSYVVWQNFRGVAAFLVYAETGKEALAKVNAGGSDDVEGLDKDATEIFKARHFRLDAKNVKRKS